VSPMDAPRPPTAATVAILVEQLASMCQRASLFEETSLRMARRVDLVESAISHLHRPRYTVAGGVVCAECQTEWPCRTKALVTEVLL
jgi:hypothetical protein